MAPAGVRAPVNHLDAHFLHQRGDLYAPDRMTRESQTVVGIDHRLALDPGNRPSAPAKESLSRVGRLSHANPLYPARSLKQVRNHQTHPPLAAATGSSIA